MSACVTLSDHSPTSKNRASKTLISALSSSQPKPNDKLLVPTPYPCDVTEDPTETIEQVDVDVGTIEPFDIDVGAMELSDVDALDEKGTSQSLKVSDNGCSRYRLTFLAGKSPYSAYPFGLHDIRPLPWKSILVDDTMAIFSRGCTGKSHMAGGQCRPCQQLPENKKWREYSPGSNKDFFLMCHIHTMGLAVSWRSFSRRTPRSSTIGFRASTRPENCWARQQR